MLIDVNCQMLIKGLNDNQPRSLLIDSFISKHGFDQPHNLIRVHPAIDFCLHRFEFDHGVFHVA